MCSSLALHAPGILFLVLMGPITTQIIIVLSLSFSVSVLANTC